MASKSSKSEMYNKPTLVCSFKKDGYAKGSCRSVANFNILEALKSVAYKPAIEFYSAAAKDKAIHIQGDKINYYNNTKKALLDEGIIRKTRGKGGAICLIKHPLTTTGSEDGSLETQREKLLGLLPRDGRKIPNKDIIAVWEKDGLAKDDYWTIRNALIDKGILGKGRGQEGYCGDLSAISDVNS
jgi:hypothetical protein